MKNSRSDMSWTYAIRNNPIQSDPAPIVGDQENREEDLPKKENPRVYRE